MDEVIPSFYGISEVGGPPRALGGAMDNSKLRPGEVINIIYPDDKRSRTKRFIEYDVLVQHSDNGTTVSKMYHNCLLANPLAGFADKAVWTLRTSEQQSRGAISDVSTGSQVTVKCLSDEHAVALIVGGLRHDGDSDSDRKARGHHAEFEFNGVNFSANDDGSWTLTNKGKTDSKGGADAARDTVGAGTVVKVSANGDFEAVTASGQFVKIDHKGGNITVSGDNLVETIGDRINLGAGAGEPIPMGDTLQGLMEEMIELIIKPDAYMTAVGPTVQAIHILEWKILKAKLETMKSHQSYVKRSPR